MYTHVYPCKAMYIHVQPCISMYTHVYPCTSMYNHVQLCISMYSHFYPCTSMYTHVYPFLSMYSHVYLCTAMYIYACLCIPCIFMQSLKPFIPMDTHLYSCTAMRPHPYRIAKIAFITARIIVSLDFTSAVHHMIHFIYHFIVSNCLHKNDVVAFEIHEVVMVGRWGNYKNMSTVYRISTHWKSPSVFVNAHDFFKIFSFR